MGEGWKHKLFCADMDIHRIPSKNCFGTSPPPMWGGKWKHEFFVQIWTFNVVSSKNIFLIGPYPNPKGMGFHTTFVQKLTFHEIPIKNVLSLHLHSCGGEGWKYELLCRSELLM